jgi:hypothetical protein
MKKNHFSYSRMAATIAIISATACSIAWINPSLFGSEKDKSQGPGVGQNVNAALNMSEEAQLVQALQNDGLINQISGFVVEKNRNLLFIDGVQQPANVADKYMSTLKKDVIRVQVFSFMERQRQHPDADFLQNLLPVMFSSPCIDTKPKKKDGC